MLGGNLRQFSNPPNHLYYTNVEQLQPVSPLSDPDRFYDKRQLTKSLFLWIDISSLNRYATSLGYLQCL